MELIKVVNARNVLDNLSDLEDLGAHLAYWMTKFVVKTGNEHDFYVAETRKLIDKYADVGEDGSFHVCRENIEEFNKAVEALNQTDVEEPGIRFNLSELSSVLKLSMKQRYSLLDFIDEDK